MTDLISRDELRHQVNLLINAKPFDCEPYKDGQYAGLRTAIRIINAEPCVCDMESIVMVEEKETS